MKPHRTATVDTIRRWILSLMFAAEIDVETFYAHSVPVAPTSAAASSGASLENIMGSVGWAS